MPEPYQPVSCQLHSELELIIMHKQTIRLQTRNRYTLRYYQPLWCE